MKTIILLTFSFFSNCRAIHYPNYKDHECKRTCVKGDKRTCRYELTAENRVIMPPECGDCGRNEADCFNENCLVADGGSKQALVFNRMLPGPMIEVCQNDTIDVLFRNDMMEQATSIHWHGMHQVGTQYMDGVAFITQCPTLTSTAFRYTFEAKQKGTHFYHAHHGFQRNSGLFGALIVKTPPSDSDKKLFDYQLSEHIISIADWTYDETIVHFNRFYRMNIYETDVISALLVNGIGGTINNSLPIHNFTVEKGYKYRFRFIHAGFIMCKIKIQIQNHNMTVISTDGQDIEPFIADTIHLSNGERTDVVIHANQSVGYYWIKFTGGVICDNKEAFGLLKYKNVEPNKPPWRNQSQISLPAKKQLNCLNTYSNVTSCTFYHQLKYKGDDDNLALKTIADITYYIGYTFYKYVKPEYEGFNTSQITNPALNNITMVMPKRPMIFGDAGLKYCNNETKSRMCDPNEALCDCTHVVKFPMNKTIEIVLVDEGAPEKTMHPMHLHGYGFRVVAEEKMGDYFYVDTFQELDAKNKIKRNLDNPPIKDTINPPAGGYTILRFHTNNPGYWIMHCHVEHHTEVGMSMIFKVGDVINEPPAHFPICGSMFEYDMLKVSIAPPRKKQKIPLL